MYEHDLLYLFIHSKTYVVNFNVSSTKDNAHAKPSTYVLCGRYSSFLAFLASLIDHPEDVKELRSKGSLLNLHGSDEEVVNLFNIISTNVVHDGKTFYIVRRKIHEHYYNKYKTWIAQGFHTHFSNPWAIIAFTATFITLVLTFI